MKWGVNKLKEPKRILHIVGAMYPGGIENFIMNLYEKIDRERFQFDFIVHMKKEKDYTERICLLGGKVYEIPRLTQNPVKSLWKLYKIIRENHYELVIRHTANALVMPQLLMAKLAGAKTICHSHSEQDPQVFLHKIGKLFLPVVTDEFFACSRKAGQWMYGGRAFQIIHNAIDIEKFSFKKEFREEVRKEFGLKENHIYGHIGNLVECKNHLFLLEVFAEIVKMDSTAILFIVGEGEYREKIEDKIKELSLEKKVILTGIRHDVPQFMSCMDVLIFPSVFEGLPLTLIEAQIAALPAIISDTITEDVIVTKGLVSRRSITEEPKKWALQGVDLVKKQDDRTCQRNEIANAGYDMNKLVKWYEGYFER